MINQTFDQMVSILSRISALDRKGGSVPYGQKATQNNGHLANYSRTPSVGVTKGKALTECTNATTRLLNSFQLT